MPAKRPAKNALAKKPRRKKLTVVPLAKALPKRKTISYFRKHSDGSLWAKGQTLDGKMTGFWKWFRKDGSVMRTGYFEKGLQVGTWTTYASDGRVVKVTQMKSTVP